MGKIIVILVSTSLAFNAFSVFFYPVFSVMSFLVSLTTMFLSYIVLSNISRNGARIKLLFLIFPAALMLNAVLSYFVGFLYFQNQTIPIPKMTSSFPLESFLLNSFSSGKLMETAILVGVAYFLVIRSQYSGSLFTRNMAG